MTCESICDRNEHKTEAPPRIRVAHAFDQFRCANKRKVLAGDPGCDGGLEPGLDFMPLPCVDPGFANSYYFSQESCQKRLRICSLFSDENSLCPFSRSEHKMVLPSTDNQPCV